MQRCSLLDKCINEDINHTYKDNLNFFLNSDKVSPSHVSQISPLFPVLIIFFVCLKKTWQWSESASKCPIWKSLNMLTLRFENSKWSTELLPLSEKYVKFPAYLT